MKQPPPPRGRGQGGEVVSPYLLVLGAAVLWSTGGLFIKWNDLTPLELSCGRALFACATVALLTRREGFRVNFVTGAASLLYAALLLLFVVATKLTTAANAIFLQYTAPVYILLLEPALFKEKYRAQDFVVVACCLAGMSLFFVGNLRAQDVEGNVAALGSGVCFAAFFLLLRSKRAREVNRASSVIYGNLILFAATLPAFVEGAHKLDARNLAVVAYLGVVQIGVAYTLLTLGIARGVRGLDAGVIGYVEPVLNPVWVFLFLGERPSGWALTGGSIIIAAVIAHTLWKARRRRAPPALP
ncbi:MAG: DMT family transporter [Acidobacteria bacterium]|nr:DMT family transporter [Acidobacteriota bacterium]MCA1642327.1 DMT family transporter [Acidobacteriota bacterium]